MVSPHQHRDRILISQVDQGFNNAVHRDLQDLRYLHDGLLPRRMDPLHRFDSAALRPVEGNRAGLGLLRIGGILTRSADGQTVFSAVGQDEKLMGRGPSDTSRVSLYRTEIEPAPGKYPGIGLIHLVVGLPGPVDIGIKTISVFHDKLPSAHQAKPGTDFIAEFRLNLIEDLWENLIGADLVPDNIGNDLFMGRADTEITVMTVLETEKLFAI